MLGPKKRRVARGDPYQAVIVPRRSSRAALKLVSRLLRGASRAGLHALSKLFCH
jgi:hypothetical protein